VGPIKGLLAAVHHWQGRYRASRPRRDTKREQFHSNIIGQSVTLTRDEVRQRIAELSQYFLEHGVSDPAAAQHKAIVALGGAVRHQALIFAFSDTFAVIGVLLAIAAVVVLFASKIRVGGAASGAH
jgi:DHA2 family multidrug resistance protein